MAPEIWLPLRADRSREQQCRDQIRVGDEAGAHLLEGARDHPSLVERAPEPVDADTAFNVEMAAERTWLAWWRTALVATAGALGVGRLAPRLLHAAPAVYNVLGCT